MTLLRWIAIGFVIVGTAAAPLNLLHARFFSGAELARVPLVRPDAPGAQSYAPLLLQLKPEQSPVAVMLEARTAAAAASSGAGAAAHNRYLTHLIQGSAIAARAETAFKAGADNAATHTHHLLNVKINTPGLYSVLVSEAALPAFTLHAATLTVRANSRRADVINVLAGIAFMLIGSVTLFATGKRRGRGR